VKKLMALSLTSLCLLAMATVRIRNCERLLGYRIAALERERARLADEVMALRVDEAGRTAPPRLLRRALSLGIVPSLPGGGVFPELFLSPREGKAKDTLRHKGRPVIE